MKVNVNEIPSGGLEFDFNPQTKELNESLSDLLGPQPKYDVHLSVQLNKDLVNVIGRYKAQLEQECSRCAENFEQSLNKSFISTFCLKPDSFKGLMGQVQSEFDENDSVYDVDFLQGSEIDLGEVVHEQIGLDIPFQPLCSEGCQGLCTQCGQNMNLGPCGCSKETQIEEKPSPFEVLRNIRLS